MRGDVQIGAASRWARFLAGENPADIWNHPDRDQRRDMGTLANAYLSSRAVHDTMVLRCRYILGTCRGEEEMRAEARAILELLGEKP